MKATELLKQQHDEVRSMLKHLHKTNGHSRTAERLNILARSLTAHMVIEEELFYPAIIEVDEGLILEGLEEHGLARFALKRLVATAPEDRSFAAKVRALKEVIEHHVEEEEEQLFKNAERALGENSALLCKKMKRLFDATEKRSYDTSSVPIPPRPVRVDAIVPPPPVVEGEGSYTAARQYSNGVALSLAAGRSEALARKGTAVAGPDGLELGRIGRAGKDGGIEGTGAHK